VALIDGDGRVLAHLPLSTAHEFAPKGLGSGHGFGDGFGYGYGYGDFDGAGSGKK
jgi:hypothetical protein